MINDIIFNKGQGGLGRALPGQDFISAMLFYTGTLPSGFNSGNRVKKVLSIADAEALGITNTYSDETKATGTFTVTNAGTDGDTVELKVAEPRGVVSIGKYTKITADNTVTLVAVGIVAAINAGTTTHGYTATNAAGVVTITARTGLGVFLNTGTPITATYSTAATLAGTIVQFSAGVASLLAIYHYHIAEYFRIQPQGNLWLGFYAVPGAYTFSEIQTLQVFTGGLVRQLAVYVNGTALTTAMAPAIQAVLATLNTLHQPISSVGLAADISSLALTALADASLLASPNVSHIIGQDGFGAGYDLYKAYSKSITNMGSWLGSVSLAAVNEDIAWVAKFNQTNGVEMNVPAFANGVNYKDISASLEAQLNNYRYIFVKNFVGNAGTFFNDSFTSALASSDFCFIENNRTIDKAIRNIRVALLPDLNSPISLNSDGTLSDASVAHFETAGQTPLDAMIAAGELSDAKATVDPAQNVTSSGKLTISVALLPTPTARQIVVNIGFVTKL